MDGKEHVDYRKGLNNLFTRKARECYLPGQDVRRFPPYLRWLLYGRLCHPEDRR